MWTPNDFARAGVRTISSGDDNAGRRPATSVMRSCRKNSPFRLPAIPSVSNPSSTRPWTTGLAFSPSQGALLVMPGRPVTVGISDVPGAGMLTMTSLALVDAK